MTYNIRINNRNLKVEAVTWGVESEVCMIGCNCETHPEWMTVILLLETDSSLRLEKAQRVTIEGEISPFRNDTHFGWEIIEHTGEEVYLRSSIP